MASGRLPVGDRFRIHASWGMDVAMDRPVPDFRQSELVLLMRAVANGDRESFRMLYERTSAKLYGICLRLLGSDAEAQDVLQEVYVTVWRKAAQFNSSKASAITWLATLARNRSIDRLRVRRAPADDLAAAAEIADGGPSALDVIERDEDSARLTHCLDQLETRSRSMIRSAFFDGASYAELAAQEAVPLGTMKSWIRRGLLRLRECLDDD